MLVYLLTALNFTSSSSKQGTIIAFSMDILRMGRDNSAEIYGTIHNNTIQV